MLLIQNSKKGCRQNSQNIVQLEIGRLDGGSCSIFVNPLHNEAKEFRNSKAVSNATQHFLSESWTVNEELSIDSKFRGRFEVTEGQCPQLTKHSPSWPTVRKTWSGKWSNWCWQSVCASKNGENKQKKILTLVFFHPQSSIEREAAWTKECAARGLRKVSPGQASRREGGGEGWGTETGGAVSVATMDGVEETVNVELDAVAEEVEWVTAVDPAAAADGTRPSGKLLRSQDQEKEGTWGGDREDRQVEAKRECKC